MNYQFLKIEGNTAYLLDLQQGKVIVVDIEDRRSQRFDSFSTGHVVTDPVIAPRVIPVAPVETGPVVAPRSIMPPGLAAMMKEGNEMGPNSV